jgi:hypothetical protein
MAPCALIPVQTAHTSPQRDGMRSISAMISSMMHPAGNAAPSGGTARRGNGEAGERRGPLALGSTSMNRRSRRRDTLGIMREVLRATVVLPSPADAGAASSAVGVEERAARPPHALAFTPGRCAVHPWGRHGPLHRPVSRSSGATRRCRRPVSADRLASASGAQPGTAFATRASRRCRSDRRGQAGAAFTAAG